MPPCSTYVIVATKGRRAVLANLLSCLERQSAAPAKVILSACDATDIPSLPASLRTHVIVGPPGLTAQRNRALSVIPASADIVVFFDDDFVPSHRWIEHTQAFFAAYPDAVSATGHVLAEGNKTGGIAWQDGLSIVERADRAASAGERKSLQVLPNKPPYGCNMAFRWSMVRHLRFDERLLLHGWLEDRDYGVRATANNAVPYWTDALWGVHLGTRCGRVSQVRFGYAQVVNPWYLMKKGVTSPFETAVFIGKGSATNTIKFAMRDTNIDRRGRLRGNLLAVSDIVIGSWKPEHTAEIMNDAGEETR